MRRKTYYISLILFFFVTACEKETSWEFDESSPQLVVDAIITNEFGIQKVFISSSGAFNSAQAPISNVNISINDETQTFHFTENEDEPGTYFSPAFNCKMNTTYRMIVQFNNLADTAYAVMNSISPINDLNIFTHDTLYYATYKGSELPAMTEVFYNWSSVPAYTDSIGTSAAKQTHYSIHNFDIIEEFGPEKQQIFFPAGTQIIQNKYSLSSAHQQFIRSLLIETQWRGGLLDVEHANLPTNFQNGTLGWFGACMVLRDTMIVE